MIWRVAPSVTVNELAKAASLPWAEQVGRVFEAGAVGGKWGACRDYSHVAS